MTRAEAIDVLTQCRLLRESVDALEAKARERLSTKTVTFSIQPGLPPQWPELLSRLSVDKQ